MPIAVVERRPVAQRLFGGRVCALFAIGILKQPVAGGDDILNARRVLRLQHRQNIDQQSLVGKQFTRRFKLRQRRPRADAGFQHIAGLNLFRVRRQQRQVVIWDVWLPGHMFKKTVFIDIWSSYVDTINMSRQHV